ncbi:zinc finger protein, putative [Plasmodium gallinaceum]|uniref:Zinc finger protein, putative n=1 Tax=Plasmodium gallinaceum TaxID=5849 RepID=A0A1J1GMD1_PLAGA|nr:zinc finger protein, putative [Plasmodium gallinaceum]CRG93405.1 zinc finger protein, putative [Plasmodium gallinaceum]
MACTPLLSEEDLYRFRTKQCLRLAKGLCEFGLDRCQYSHSTEWIRRCPYYISLPSYLRYIPVSCPYFIKNNNEEEDKEKRDNILRNCVFLTNKDGSVNNKFYKYIEETNINKCPLGVECPLAHSIDEIDYHPLVYKTKRCEDYKQANCNRYYCPNLHGLAEQRKIKEYFIPFSNKIDIPPYPNVTIVNKIQYGSFKGQNQILNNKKKLSQNFNSSSLDYSYSYNLINEKTNKSFDFKSSSINLPYQENKIFEKNMNDVKRNTTPACYDSLMSYESTLKKKKKKNSVFSYLNNFDNKYTLYLHILKKFPYLFDLNISDMNSNNSLSSFITTELSDHSMLDNEKGKYCASDIISNNNSSENCNNESINANNLTKNSLDTKDDTLEKKTEKIFLNNTYYDILNHIFMKNLEITKEKIKYENDVEINLIDTYNCPNSQSDDADYEFFTKCANQTINSQKKVETYDSFLNLLSYILCLLYFTTNSNTHSSFDMYAHKLAKHLHCVCRKMKDAATANY